MTVKVSSIKRNSGRNTDRAKAADSVITYQYNLTWMIKVTCPGADL